MQDRILEILAVTAKDWNLPAPVAGFLWKKHANQQSHN